MSENCLNMIDVDGDVSLRLCGDGAKLIVDGSEVTVRADDSGWHVEYGDQYACVDGLTEAATVLERWL